MLSPTTKTPIARETKKLAIKLGTSSRSTSGRYQTFVHPTPAWWYRLVRSALPHRAESTIDDVHPRRYAVARVSFPYDDLPWDRSWKRAVRDTPAAEFDPQGSAKFVLERTAAIASAGSCFAIRLAEWLRETGFAYMNVEPGGDLLPHDLATRYGYRPLPARYGNVYTSRQLLQLFRRAFGTFAPVEGPWRSQAGYVDPFRPRIQPQPFASIAELERDRRNHLAAVRSMFERLDLFVFTLGLTEVWTSFEDGAAFPACPGRGFGVFDASHYRLVNLNVAAVIADLNEFVAELSQVNRSARVVLTVSPVPIAATMLPMHVARASMLAKSTLVVAAEMVAAQHAHVDYFASYETVTYGGNDAFCDDRRHISPAYVERVVAGLMRHYFEVDLCSLNRTPAIDPEISVKPCDEDELAAAMQQNERQADQ